MFDRKEKTSTFFGNGTWLDVKYLKRRSQNSKFIFLSKPYQHSLRITTSFLAFAITFTNSLFQMLCKKGAP